MNGYSYEPESNSPYLKLSGKGESVKVRLASDPYHFVEEYDGEEQERFAWIVIDRKTGKIRTFKGGVMIYKAIKAYANNEEWGDPTKYDFTITRTEEKGSYYTIAPSPDKSEITDEEQKQIKEANFQLKELYKSIETTVIQNEESQVSSKEDEINIEEISF